MDVTCCYGEIQTNGRVTRIHCVASLALKTDSASLLSGLIDIQHVTIEDHELSMVRPVFVTSKHTGWLTDALLL